MQNSIDEGYIKFKTNWIQKPPLPHSSIKELNHWRQVMYKYELIGAYDNGIGFGNISQRTIGNRFIISGSKTGNFHNLTDQHYSTVTKINIDSNSLTCEGPCIASSEAMSHAVIYQQLPDIQAVIHVHHLELWKKLLFKIPTTASGATYGTPEMANSIIHLIKHTNVRNQKIFAMQEHREGIFVFGNTFDQAAALILEELNELTL